MPYSPEWPDPTRPTVEDNTHDPTRSTDPDMSGKSTTQFAWCSLSDWLLKWPAWPRVGAILFMIISVVSTVFTLCFVGFRSCNDLGLFYLRICNLLLSLCSNRVCKSSSRSRNVAATWSHVTVWWRHRYWMSYVQWALDADLCGWSLDWWHHRKLLHRLVTLHSSSSSSS